MNYSNIVIISFLSLLFAEKIFADVVVVKRNKTPVHEAASMSAAVIFEFSADTKLDTLSRSGSFFLVNLPTNAKKKQGFVRLFDVKQVPLSETERKQKIEAETRKNEKTQLEGGLDGRRRTSTQVMGIRGLASSSESENFSATNNASKKLGSNKRELQRIEQETAFQFEFSLSNDISSLTDTFQAEVSKNLTSAESQPNGSQFQEEWVPEENQLERDMGREMAAQLLSKFEAVNHKPTSVYLTTLANYLQQNAFPKSPELMRIALVKSSEVNAYACPGNYIFLTTKTLLAAENEAELAAIISHEIAHIQKKHVLQALKRKRIETVKKESKSSSKPFSADAYINSRQRPAAKNTFAGASFLNQLTGNTNLSGALLDAAENSLNIVLETGLEKEMEFEADAIGAKISSYAGYNSNALPTFFARMQNTKQNKVVEKISQTHPPYDARIQTLQLLLPYLSGNFQFLQKNRFLEIKQQLTTFLRTQQ